MDEEQAKYHMKRCIDSGLWVPDARNAQPVAGGGEEEDHEAQVPESVEDEPVYAEAGSAS